MVGEFVGGALGRDAPPLVEGFVEDAFAVEGAAVVAGGDAGALPLVNWVFWRMRRVGKGGYLPLRLLTSQTRR